MVDVVSVNRNAVWTKERDDALRAMVAAKMTTRAIGEAMTLSQSMVARRIQYLGLREELQRRAPEPPRSNHIVDYKLARRGFHVPEHLERDYYELLKTGIPIVEACRRLGIETQPQTRGA